MNYNSISFLLKLSNEENITCHCSTSLQIEQSNAVIKSCTSLIFFATAKRSGKSTLNNPHAEKVTFLERARSRKACSWKFVKNNYTWQKYSLRDNQEKQVASLDTFLKPNQLKCTSFASRWSCLCFINLLTKSAVLPAWKILSMLKTVLWYS